MHFHPSGGYTLKTRHATRASAWLALVVAAFVALSFLSGYNQPLLAGFDETAHYRAVDYYARHAALPDLNQAPSHEAHQPPLYYAVGALLIAPMDRSDLDAVLQSTAPAPDNPRYHKTPLDIVHVHGVAQAVLILRLLSTLLGAVTVILTWLLARQLKLSPQFSLLAAALVAFNPKFLLLSASVSNDIAAICASVFCLVLCAWTMNRTPSVLGAFGLGAAVGLAALCKTSGLGLGLPAVFALGWSWAKTSRPRHFVRDLLMCGLAAALGGLLVVGWLYAYQWSRYGSPLAWEQVNMLNRFALREAPLDAGQLASILPSILPTLWRINPEFQLNGIGDILASIILVTAVAGWSIGIARRSLPGGLSLLPIAILGSLIALAPWMRQYGGTEDSRLLPTLFTGMAILSAAGIAVISARLPALRRWPAPVIAGVSLVWAGIAPFVLIAPGFPVVLPVTGNEFVPQLPMAERDHLPQTPVALFENGIQLAQAVIAPDRLSAGDPMLITLTWRVTRPVLHPNMLVLEAFDADKRSIGKLDTRPLAGRRSTALWQVGDVYREIYTLTLATSTSDAPVIASVYAGWHEADPPYTVSGVISQPGLSALVGQAKVRAAQPPAAPEHAVDAVFGGIIALDGYDVQGSNLTLHWHAVGPVPLDYQVFVHVLDAQGQAAGQADGPLPLPAALWDKGEIVLDQRQVLLPANGGSIQVGVYELANGARLPALRADGSRWGDDSVVLPGAR